MVPTASLVFLLTLVVSFHPVRLRMPTRTTTQAPTFPAVLQDGDLAMWRVPNPVFCGEMERTLDRVLVLPWWHHYCQDLKDKQAKLPPRSYYQLPVHRLLLQRAQQQGRRLQLGRLKHSTWTWWRL